MNPIALILTGTFAAFPIMIMSCLNPMQTERGKLAQGYLHMVYLPLTLLQILFIVVSYHVTFLSLPHFYITSARHLISVPCLMLWCVLLFVGSRYGHSDVKLVKRQRCERAHALLGRPSESQSDLGVATDSDRIDCSVSSHHHWELIFSAWSLFAGELMSDFVSFLELSA